MTWISTPVTRPELPFAKSNIVPVIKAVSLHHDRETETTTRKWSQKEPHNKRICYRYNNGHPIGYSHYVTGVGTMNSGPIFEIKFIRK